MAPVVPICKNCKYLVGIFCCRYPPSVNGVVLKNNMPVAVINRWPVITNLDTDTCGEFSKK